MSPLRDVDEPHTNTPQETVTNNKKDAIKVALAEERPLTAI